MRFSKHKNKSHSYILDLETKQILSIVDENGSCTSILVIYVQTSNAIFLFTDFIVYVIYIMV